MHINPLLPLVAVIPLLLGGCGDDPIGPDNRMALRALGLCRYDQALQLTDNAIERGSQRNAQQALVLQAAILRDQGENTAAEALYPRITETWQAVKRRPLSPEQREREIRVVIDVARDERIVQGLDPDCGDRAASPSTP